MIPNLLFTCAGRRHYLLKYFQENKPANSQIIAADMQSSAPALTIADKAYVVPAGNDVNYISSIKDICIWEKVSAIISLNDLELPVLAKHKTDFEMMDITLIVSDREVIDICLDKWKTGRFAAKIGLNYPKTYLTTEDTIQALNNKEINFPILLKPRWGSASIEIELAETIEELHLAYNLLKKKLLRSMLKYVNPNKMENIILFQEKIPGKEFGLDVFNDLKGNLAAVYVKEKLAMRAGETDKAVLRDRPAIREIGEKIGCSLKHIGNLDVDIFEYNGQFFLIDMNPRFGGGYPFSHMAGANFPAAIYSWLKGKKAHPSCFQYQYDKAFAKCDILVELNRDTICPSIVSPTL